MGPACEAEIMPVCPDVFRLVCTVPIIACTVRRTRDELAFRYGVGLGSIILFASLGGLTVLVTITVLLWARLDGESFWFGLL